MYIPENVNTRCGIYMIKNMRSGKKYIGSTKNGPERRANHFSLLRKGQHHCDHLQNAWNKEDDKSVFQFSMFLYCKEDDLLKFEQSCFDHMKPEYNIAPIAGRPAGFDSWSVERQEEHRERARNRFSGPGNPIYLRPEEELSDYGRYVAQQALAKGNHSSQTLTPEQLSERSRQGALTQLANGNHPSQIVPDEEWSEIIQRRAETLRRNGNGKKAAKKQVDEGRHPFQLRTKEQNVACAKNAVAAALRNGTHISQTKTAEERSQMGYKRWATRRWKKLEKLLEDMAYWGA